MGGEGNNPEVVSQPGERTPKFRLDFFNAPRSLHPFIASLLTAGSVDRFTVDLSGKASRDGKPPRGEGVALIIQSLADADGTGDNWTFDGYLAGKIEGLGLGDRSIKGFIRLSDGAGYLASKS